MPALSRGKCWPREIIHECRMSTLEKQEYSRGYRRGTGRMRYYANLAFAIAKDYRKKLLVLQSEKFGRDNWLSRECQTCERWTRGGPGQVMWGRSSAHFLAEAGEPGMWTEGATIFTHENFGCCSHL